MSEADSESGKKQTKPVEPIAPSLGFLSPFTHLISRINYASSPLLEYAYPPINETIVQNITNGMTSSSDFTCSYYSGSKTIHTSPSPYEQDESSSSIRPGKETPFIS